MSSSTGKNVVDFYKSWEDDEIKADLDKTRLPLRVVCENINGDFNKSSCLRSAEGFNLESFALAGGKRMDMRGAVGAQHRITVEKFDTVSEALNPLYTTVALDNVDGAVDIRTFKFPKYCNLLIGEEQRGLSEDALDEADHIVYIPMRGAVRSFNVASAATVAMYEYTRQHGG